MTPVLGAGRFGTVLAVMLGGFAATARGLPRLQEADSTRHRNTIRAGVLPRNSWYPVPVLSKTQVAGLKGQVVLALLHRFSLDSITRPSLLFVTVIATQKHQYAAAGGGDVWFKGNTRNINYIGQYQQAPAPFYGIGPHTTAAAAELYDSRVWSGPGGTRRGRRRRRVWGAAPQAGGGGGVRCGAGVGGGGGPAPPPARCCGGFPLPRPH